MININTGHTFDKEPTDRLERQIRDQYHEIQRIGRELKGRPWQPIREADAWLRLACPCFYEHGVELDKTGLVTPTETGFDWRGNTACLASMLKALGFKKWTEAGKYLSVRGKPVKALEQQIKQTQLFGSTPRGWEKVLSIFPDLKLPR